MIVAVLSGFALLTAACGNTPQNPGTSQPPATTQPPAGSMGAGQGNADPAKIEFANGICTAVQKFIGPATAFKPDTSSPAAALNSLKTQLGTMSAGLDSAAGDLGNVKSDGVPDGKTAVTELQKTFGQLKQTVDTAKTKLDGIDPNNPQAISTGVQDVSKDLASSRPQQPSAKSWYWQK